jgi:hypothetical protein
MVRGRAWVKNGVKHPGISVSIRPRLKKRCQANTLSSVWIDLGIYRCSGTQTAVFELDIRISNPPYIDVCQSLASGRKSRNVEKRINAV